MILIYRVPVKNQNRLTNLFPAMMLQMTAIGEESGALDNMLDKSATYHEEVVDNIVQIGFGLNESADDFFTGAGFVFRV